MDALIRKKTELMINIAASPFDYKHDENRIKILGDNSRKYGLPLLYVNHVGSQTEMIFDGGSLVFNKNGELLDEMPYFEEAVRIYEFKDRKIIGLNPIQPRSASAIETIHDALVLGIRDYFRKS